MIVNNEYHHKKHYKKQIKSRKTIYFTLLFTLFFAIVELVGGYISNSLSLIGDSFHMFSDVLALASSAIAIYFVNKKPTKRFTFGFLRLEIIVAFLNGITLMLIAVYVFLEGIKRFLSKQQIDLKTMLIVSITGLLVNIFVTLILHNSMTEENNLNVKSAMLHFIGDLLNSIGVIISSILIYFTGITQIDIIMSFIIASIIFIGGYNISKESGYILMEAVPLNIDIDKIKNEILNIDGILNIHELHIWNSDSEEISFMAHILLNNYEKYNNYKIIENIKIILNKYNIFHITIQIEDININKHE